MNDAQTTLQQLKDQVEAMVAEREWHPFHTLKNLSMNLSVEASELMEIFLWVSEEQSGKTVREKRNEVEQELADVMIAAIAFANAADINIAQVFEQKLQEVKQKYPADLARGKSDKYTAYMNNKKK